MSEADVLISTGTVLGGRYRVANVIGSGGSATVFRADVLATGARVAIKLMHAGHPESDAERVRFGREAEVLQTLKHRHIVELLDFGFAHDELRSPYLVFPLLAGRTLNKKLDAEAPLAHREAGEIAEQVLLALEAAHQRGITHRDIKPANVYLCPAPPSELRRENVKLLDFGLAKLTAGGAKQRMDVTQMGAVLGTPRYMAPEQARGEQVGPAADIYAMGLVLGELVTGNPIVTAKGEIDIFVAHGSDRPLALPDRLVQSPYGPIVSRACAKRPEQRYRVATQMLADVRAVLERLAFGPGQLSSPELEVTSKMPRVRTQHLSIPNEMSERLREVFNSLATDRMGPGPGPPPLPADEAAPEPSVQASQQASQPDSVEESIEVDMSSFDGDDVPPPRGTVPIPQDRPTVRMALDLPEERVSEPIALVRRVDAPRITGWEDEDTEEPPHSG